MPRPVRRRAFTLLELLVVLAILGVLLALLLPAVQKVRAAAAAASCRNNLRQIALAALQFHDANDAFPPARIAPRPDGAQPQSLDCGGQEASWLVRLMPFLEEQNAFAEWDLTRPYQENPDSARMKVVRVYSCPARRSASEAVIPSVTGPPIRLPCGCSFPGKPISGGAVGDYGGNHGDLSPGAGGLATDFYWGGNGTGVIVSSRGVCADGRPRDWRDRVRLADVTDGASNTFLAGEMHVPRGKLATVPDNGPLYDGASFYNMSRVGGPGVPLARGPDDDVLGMGLFAFGSWHAGVCHFAFADGRVSAVRTQINTQVLERLCNRSDGGVVGDY